MIFEEHLSIPVGIEGHELAVCIQQIGFRHRLLNHFIGTRQQIFHLCAAICTGGHFPYPGAVHGPYLEHGARHHFPGIGIPFVDGQIGALVVLDGQSAGFAREQLHLVFFGIENVVGHSGSLFDGIDARLQIAHQDFTSIVCGSIQVVCPVLDLAEAKSNTAQRSAVSALLQQPQRGLNGVGEHEFAGLTRLQVDDLLGIVNHIAVGLFLRHHISARLQLGQVDFAVFIGGEFFRAELSTIALDLKDHIGNDLAGIGRIDLHQVQSRFAVIEEYQLQDAAAFGQLDLLGHGVHHMLIVTLHFLYPVSARLQVSEKDFAQAVGLISADQLIVFINLKGDVRQGFMGLPVILNHTQTRLGTVLQCEGNGVLPGHIDGVSLAVLDPSIGGFQLHDLICTGLQFIEDSHTGFVGDLGVSGSGLDVLDLHLGSREGIAGVSVYLFHSQIAIRFVFIAHRSHGVLFYLYLLYRILCHQVALGGLHLGDGVQTTPLQRNNDLALGVGGECSHRRAVRVFHFKQGSFQASAGACFGLDDLQAVLTISRSRRCAIGGIIEQRICPGSTHRVSICNVVLQLAIGAGLLANSIEGSVLVHIALQQEFHTGAAGNRIFGANDFELSLIARTFHRDLFDLLVVHVDDLHAVRHIFGIKPDADLQAVHPGAALDGVDLLQVSLTIDLHLVGILLIGGNRQAGNEHICPSAAPVINVLGRCQKPLGDLLFVLRQARGDGYFVDAPIGHQIAPQSDLGGIVGLLYIVQAQLFQTAVRISIAHNAHNLGI